MEEKKEQKETEIQETQEKIIPRVIEDEMKQSYVDYAMSVIVGRALPDVRDGLKPVHRRILYAMYDMGMLHNRPFKKSARIVGEVLGKYHPHGDTAVYDTMVRMTQAFSLRYPLVHGQGNWGSIDGDSAAAMRYTEARLKKLSEEIMQDIDKETVKFVDNFDGSLKEPAVLPCKVPNLLINGSSGIAVGMATNVPPHNMGEVCDAVISQIENPDISVLDLMQNIQGPDFPTGGLICGKNGIRNAYSTGRGKLTIRAKTDIEERGDKQSIIISEIPYMVNKSEMVKEIADLVKDRKIRGISDIRDESDKDGIRVVIELKGDTNVKVVLNQLYKHTRAQTTFGIIMLALVDGEPHVLNLKQLLQHYIDHRKDVITKRTKFDLRKAEERAHILAGIITALDNIDDVIKIIKNAKLVSEAKASLMKRFDLTEKQAIAILDMKLQRLTSLEQEKVKKEREELLKLIEELKAILGSEQRILDIIKKELHELKSKYADERRTEITDVETTELNMEDLVKPADMIITVSHAGYIKRLPVHTYKQQRRGGKGVIGAGKKEEDFIESLFVANTHSYILFFTNKGKVHWLKVYYIPEASRQARGKAIVNLLQLDKDEKITAFVPVKEFDDSHFIVMVTKNGIIKKTNLEEFSNPRKTGIIACKLRGDDELINVGLTDGNKNIVIATKNGMAVRFKEDKVRAMGRTAAGVRGITLRNDKVVGMVVADGDATLLTVTENGYGKRTKLSAYRETNRGGVGVRNIICSERNGKVVGVRPVTDYDDLMFISKNGIIIRTAGKGLSVIGRNTQGVRVMKLSEEDKLVAAAKVVKENGE
jgi:DNA gyrase subunit A